MKQEKPEPSDTNEPSKTLSTNENVPAPPAQHGLQSSLPVNLSATIDDTGNIAFEEAHTSGVRMSAPPELGRKSPSTESPLPPKIQHLQ